MAGSSTATPSSTASPSTTCGSGSRPAPDPSSGRRPTGIPRGQGDADAPTGSQALRRCPSGQPPAPARAKRPPPRGLVPMWSRPAVASEELSMAHLRCDFFSDVLGLSTAMTVLLPQETSAQIGMRGTSRGAVTPVLYLLHGLSDDDTIWLRRTSIERYVAPLGLAVVMPQVHRSFYQDEHYGRRYWTFLSEELPELVASWFQVSQRREDTFVAGLSMGGYGALKWALRQPEHFAAAASLSGAVNVAGLRTGRVRPEDPRMFERIFGDRDVAGTPDDLFWLVAQAAPAS